jgi:uncharacterized protein YprB with RNaseH-like and TPR domain
LRLTNMTCSDIQIKYRAYLDIETTGLSHYYSDITVIGVALEKNRKCKVVQLINNNIYEANLLKVLTGVDEIYSYNGSRFDLPYIKTKLGIDLNDFFKHTDLMYDCWRQNLKGGLKVVERLLGVDRQLNDVDGYMAVQLWWDYVNNLNEDPLHTLLAYNKEDVVNLRVLRRKLRVR